MVLSKVSGSALAAEICTGPHSRLLRRQHSSSLCSQSEGHEHVANMTSALAHDFVGFSARAWPPQYSPPSLCKQSELQCFASYLCQMSARGPLQQCRISPPFSLAPFFSSASIVSRLSSLVCSFHDSSPSFPFFHIPQSLLIIIGYFFFFINRKYYDDYDRAWKLWIKKRLRNPPKVIHSYCRFIPILIHKAGVAERRYCSGI